MNATVREVEQFSALLSRATGLRFEADKRERLASVLSTRVLLKSCASVEHYLTSVADRDDELAKVAEHLTVTETYFFRDEGQFEALRAIVQQIAKDNGRPLMMISAACSSGEEPYSMAMTVQKAIPDHENRLIQIDALDLNPRALRIAEAAQYRHWSMRSTSQEQIDEFFTQDGGKFLVRPNIARMVRFRCENLARPRRELAPPSSVDVIFCRNALMYLHADAMQKIVARFARALRPGGFLFLGHAENLRGVSRNFDLHHEFGTFFYERHTKLQEEHLDFPSLEGERTGAAPPAVINDTSWYAAVARSAERITALSKISNASTPSPEVTPQIRPTPGAPERGALRLTVARDLMKRERFQEALQQMSPMTTPGEDPEEDLLRAMLLVGMGRFVEARELCDSTLLADNLNPGAHYIRSLCEESLGNFEASALESQSAIYLDENFAMPHLQLGRLARRSRDYMKARVELELALRLLNREDPARILLFGGGFGRASLIRACQMELTACERDS